MPIVSLEKPRTFRRLWPWLLVVLAAAAAVLWPRGAQFTRGSQVAPVPGYTAPAFSLRDLEGKGVRLADLRGKNVFLNFWATWCPACRGEMPAIQKVYEEVKSQGDWVFLAVDVQEHQKAVSEFMDRNGLTFRAVLDTDGTVAGDYMVRGIPTSIFIDKNGVIRDRVVGGMDEESFRAKIRALSQGGGA